MLNIKVYSNSNGYNGLEVYRGKERLICDYSSTHKEIELILDVLEATNDCQYELIER